MRASPGALKTKDWIFALEVDGARKVYPLKTLLKNPLVNDLVAGKTVLILTDPASEAVRAYLTSGRRFKRSGRDGLIDEKSGEEFVMNEESLENRARSLRLPRAAGHRAYWFGWYAFFPGTEIYAAAE